MLHHSDCSVVSSLLGLVLAYELRHEVYQFVRPLEWHRVVKAYAASLFGAFVRVGFEFCQTCLVGLFDEFLFEGLIVLAYSEEDIGLWTELFVDKTRENSARLTDKAVEQIGPRSCSCRDFRDPTQASQILDIDAK